MGGNSAKPFGVSPFMRALVYDPQAPANLRFDEVAEPSVADSQALIDVHAIALNFGEVHFIDQMRRPGEVPGWDSAGIVARAAADGTGPAVGTRVVGFSGEAGWAERRAVSTENLAELPEFVEFEEGAAFVTGSGSNAPKGIVTAISATAGSTVPALAAGFCRAPLKTR